MQDDSRRQPEGRDGQDRHGAEPGGRARQDGEPGASRRRRPPGRPDQVPGMEGPGLAADDPRHAPRRGDRGIGRRPRGGDAPPPRGRRPHALQHRARRHGDGGVHGDVPRADDGRLARAHQAGLRLRHRRLRAHPGDNPHQRLGRRGQRPHTGFRRVPPGVRHDRPPEDREPGQEADKPRPLRRGHPRHALRLPQQPRKGGRARRQRAVREGVPRLRDRGAPRRLRRGVGRCRGKRILVRPRWQGCRVVRPPRGGGGAPWLGRGRRCRCRASTTCSRPRRRATPPPRAPWSASRSASSTRSRATRSASPTTRRWRPSRRASPRAASSSP